MGNLRRAGIAAAAAAAPLGLAYRFALAYRVRAGYPRRNPPRITPADLGLPYESMLIESDGVALPAWFIPARGGERGPGVVLVHGWESARDRTLPLAMFLHAAGFHCLTFDVRGNGENPPEALPLTAGEFGQDSLAAFHALIEQPEVSVGAIVGHSMGGIGSILAAAADPRVAAVVATSSPAGPYRLTRLTFQLARLPIPDLIAYPLAWLTTRVYLRPRGHVVGDVSATAAIARYEGPVLLAHGDDDTVVPVSHFERLAAAARASRVGEPDPAPVETLVVAGGAHSWLYEDPGYRRAVASFLAAALGGPLDPATAGEVAAETQAMRIPDLEAQFEAIDELPGGLRTLAQVALPGATRPPLSREAPPSSAPRARVDPPSRERSIALTRSGTRSRPSASSVASPSARSNRPIWSASSMPAGTRAAARTSSAGRSSSAATAPTSPSWRRSARGPDTSPAPPSRSRSSPRTRRPPTRRCRSCSISGRRPRT